jgi:flagella basal body P-ring formation protein FlgA
MIRVLVITLTALLLTSATAAAQSFAALPVDRPMLRSSVTVSDDVIRIGDLVDHAGIVAKIPIFRAPDPGMTGTVSAAEVIEAVQAHAIVGLSPGGIDEIRVTRASRAISVDDIEAQIIALLASQHALGDPKDIMLRFDRSQRVVHVDARAAGEIQIDTLRFEPRNGRFDVIAKVAGITATHIRFSGLAYATAEIQVLTRSLARGDIVKRSDITLERRARSAVTADLLTAANDIVGRAVRHAIGAGRPLRAADLTKPELVQRNQMVTLIYEIPGITLTVRGKANESGAEGDVIEILNVQSKRPVHGVVMGPGRVVVSTYAANNTDKAKFAKSSLSTDAAIRAQ